MSKQLTVRDVPDDVVQTLREEAEAHGRSVNAVVREVLADYAERHRHRRGLADVLREMDDLRARIREENGGVLLDSVPLIRATRDA